MQRSQFDRLGRSAGNGPSFRGALARLHADEQGDEGVNKILIIAMIVIPLVIVLIVFGKDIVKFFNEAWTKLTGEKGTAGETLGAGDGGGM